MPKALLPSLKNPLLLEQLQQAKRIIAVGEGRSGSDAAALLEHFECSVWGYTESNPVNSVFRSHRDWKSIVFDQKNDVAVLSPGFSLDHPFCQRLLAAGVPVISEIELGLAALPKHSQVLGVTGTNGKSTVTYATAELLKSVGFRAVAAGNIGQTLSSTALSLLKKGDNDLLKTNDVVVLELSSYQLETTWTPLLDALAFTNLSEDHLARYGSLENYFLAKWRGVHLVKKGGQLLMSPEVLTFALRNSSALPPDRELTLVESAGAKSFSHETAVSFEHGLSLPVLKYGGMEHVAWPPYQPSAVCAHAFLDNGSLVINWKGGSLQLSDSKLRGGHNAQNLAFVWALCQGLAANADGTLGMQLTAQHFQKFFSKSSNEFEPLPHRMEPLNLSSFNINWRAINDSKSTSFLCTAKALNCTSGSVLLILGGQLKETDVSLLFETPPQPQKLKVICYGSEAEKLKQALEAQFKIQAYAVPSFDAAIDCGLNMVQSKETLLFSPGAASFDSHKNFEERGEDFKMKVKRSLAHQA